MSKPLNTEVSALLQKMRRSELSDSEWVRLKSLCSEDPFLTDAIGGLSLLPPQERVMRIQSIEKSLQALLEERKKKRPLVIVLRRVAAVAMLIIGIWAIWQAFPDEKGTFAERSNKVQPENVEHLASEQLKSEIDESESGIEKNQRNIVENNTVSNSPVGASAQSTSPTNLEDVPEVQVTIPEDEQKQDAIIIAELSRETIENKSEATISRNAMRASPDTNEKQIAAVSKPEDQSPKNPSRAIYDTAENDVREKAIAADDVQSDSLTDAIANIDQNDQNIPAEINKPVNEDLSGGEDWVIRGSVSDESGEPLVGANVVISGTFLGTVTDFDGNFALDIPGDLELVDPIGLVVNYVGYTSQVVETVDGGSVNIILQEGVDLGEVVVTGLGIKRENKALGYGVTTIGSKSKKQNPKKSKNQGPRHVSYAMATPVNGWKSYYKYVRKNISTPEQAKQAQIEGTVMLEFDLKSDGTPHNFRITQSLGYGCDEEAIRLVGDGPKWDVENAQVPIGGLSIDF